MDEQAWCRQDLAVVFREVGSSENGLSSAEALRRLKTDGRNDIPRREKRLALEILLEQVKSPLILILAAASVVSYLMGDVTEALIILAIVVVNSVLGFFQEYKSEKALGELIKYVSFNARVMRDGRLASVDTRDVSVGDVVLLEAGDRVPADMRMFSSEELSVDESVITGESNPVHKVVEPVKAENPLPQDMRNIAFMGTMAVDGRGKGVVVATAERTFFGRTAAYLKAEVPEAEFQRGVREFGNMLLKFITAGVVVILLSNYLLGRSFISSVLFSLALAVGIIPESLPIIITITLSRGALHMSRKGVVVKRLASIEDLGNVDVICTDKTGTLTESKITLNSYVGLDWQENPDVLKYASYSSSAVKCRHHVSGNPIDLAIIEQARQLRIREAFRREEFPFDYQRKRASAVVRDGGKMVLSAKGAPDAVLAACSNALVDGTIVRLQDVERQVIEKIDALSTDGYRTVGVAIKEIQHAGPYSESDECEMTLIGFLTFSDPPKKTAQAAITSFENLGIRIKVITGDNPLVAKKIAQDVGLKNTETMLGSEIDALSDEQLQAHADDVGIFAKVTPAHKFRIIAALKARGHIVGFLGDGVNDAPALREADVGISVNTGTDVSKDAADIILTHKSLRVLEEGVRSGREVFGNVTKYILNTVSANVGNMATLGITSLFLPFFPLLPSQILLANLISDAPLLTISSDKVDREELRRPRKWDMSYISTFTLIFGSVSVLFDLVTIILLVSVLKAGDILFRTGWFLESVLSEITVTFAIRTHKPFYKSRPSNLLIATSIAAAALTILLIYSPLASYFSFTKLPTWFLAVIIAITLAYFTLAEIVKRHFMRVFLTTQQPPTGGHKSRHKNSGLKPIKTG